MEEPIRTWKRDSFRLEIFDLKKTDRLGKSMLGYQFYDSRYGLDPIFEGKGFCASPLHAIDSDSVVSSMLSFFSYQPRDSEDHTESQLAWLNQHAEELGCLECEISEALSKASKEGGDMALSISLEDDGTFDTVISVYDCITGESYEERFSSDSLERDGDGNLTPDAWEYARGEIEESAWDRREALEAS